MIIKDIYNTSGDIKTVILPNCKLTNGFLLTDTNKTDLIINKTTETFVFDFVFYGDLNSLLNENISFKIDVFNGPDTLISIGDLTLKNLVDKTYSISVPVKKINLDSVLTFKISYTILKYPDEVLNREEGFYLNKNYHDFYMSIVYDLEEPTITLNEENLNTPSGLKSYTHITDVSTSSILMSYNYTGAIILNLDGVTMSEDLDYSILDGIITFKDIVPKNTVITIIYTGNEFKNGLTKDNIQIQGGDIPTTKKPGEYFYEDGKFGLILKNPIALKTIPVVVINGVTLSDALDFYVLEDNQTIILNGKLIQYDVIDIYYTSEFTTLNTTSSVKGNVVLPNPMGNEIGYLDVKISKNKEDLETSKGIQIPFIKDIMSYDFNIQVPEDGNYYITVFSIKNLPNGNDDVIKKRGNTLKINIVK